MGPVGSVLNEHQLSLDEGDGENWKLAGMPSLETWCLFCRVTYGVSAKDLSYITSFSSPPFLLPLKNED